MLLEKFCTCDVEKCPLTNLFLQNNKIFLPEYKIEFDYATDLTIQWWRHLDRPAWSKWIWEEKNKRNVLVSLQNNCNFVVAELNEISSCNQKTKTDWKCIRQFKSMVSCILRSIPSAFRVFKKDCNVIQSKASYFNK